MTSSTKMDSPDMLTDDTRTPEEQEMFENLMTDIGRSNNRMNRKHLLSLAQQMCAEKGYSYTIEQITAFYKKMVKKMIEEYKNSQQEVTTDSVQALPSPAKEPGKSPIKFNDTHSPKGEPMKRLNNNSSITKEPVKKSIDKSPIGSKLILGTVSQLSKQHPSIPVPSSQEICNGLGKSEKPHNIETSPSKKLFLGKIGLQNLQNNLKTSRNKAQGDAVNESAQQKFSAVRRESETSVKSGRSMSSESQRSGSRLSEAMSCDEDRLDNKSVFPTSRKPKKLICLCNERVCICDTNRASNDLPKRRRTGSYESLASKSSTRSNICENEPNKFVEVPNHPQMVLNKQDTKHGSSTLVKSPNKAEAVVIEDTSVSKTPASFGKGVKRTRPDSPSQMDLLMEEHEMKKEEHEMKKEEHEMKKVEHEIKVMVLKAKLDYWKMMKENISRRVCYHGPLFSQIEDNNNRLSG